MVTPETSGPDEPKRPRVGAVAMGLLGVAAGIAAIVALTQPDPPPTADVTTIPDVSVPTVATPSTTTTTPPFRVADIESGSQIRWIDRMSFVGRRIVDVVPRGNDFYAFSTDVGSASDEDSGLDAWLYDNGSRWSHVGSIPDSFRPSRVVGISNGFLAIGNTARGPGEFWTSSDGANWERADVPAPARGRAWFDGTPGVTDDFILVVATEWYDPATEPIREVLNRDYPGLQGYVDWGDEASEPTITMMAPLGIVVAVRRTADLGLPPTLQQSPGEQNLMLYVGSPNGRTWERRSPTDVMPDADFFDVGPVVEAPDGRLWLAASGDWGDGTFATGDGINWDRTGFPDIPVPMAIWNDRYVWNAAPERLPDLRVSEDLLSWEPMFAPTVGGCFCIWSRDYSPVLAAGPAGIAVTARSVRARHETSPPALERDGYRLEADPNHGSLILYKGDRAVIYGNHWRASLDHQPARLEDDGQTVVLLDPETGGDLVAFTLDELEEMELQRNTAVRVIIEEDHHIIYFSPDGVDWSTQDLGEIVAGDVYVRLVVGDDRILLLAEQPDVTVVWAGIPPQADDY